MAVAADARVRGLPGHEAGDERLDHAGPELRAQIDREVGQPHRVRQTPRLRDRGGRAAAPIGVVLGVRPELERDRRRLALARAQERRDRAVDAAAHGDKRASTRLRARRGSASSVADGGTERPRESVGGQLGRVQLARAETPELGRDLPGAESRRLEHRAAPRQRDRRAAGGGAGATPARVEAGVGDPIAVNADRELDLVAAREAADRGREGAGQPAVVALGRGQVVLEGDGIHRPRG